jgi:hypothetical protein
MNRQSAGWLRAASAASTLLVLALGGCSNRIMLPVAPKPAEPPAASTPANALHRVEWCWEHAATEPCRDLLSCDFQFVFAATDTAGNRFRARPWTRPDELDFITHLLITGSALEPPASYVTLQFEPDLVDLPDPRPGKDPGWHRRIDTRLILVVQNPEQEFRVLGYESFYIVRGDSACIPQELRDRGLVPDSTRWWIERWDDGGAAAPPGSLAAQPARLFTVGMLRALYFDGPPAP